MGLCHQPPRKNPFETCGGVRGMGRRFEISSRAVMAFKALGTESISREHGGEYHKNLGVLKGKRPTGSRERRNSHDAPTFHLCFSLPPCLSSLLLQLSVFLLLPSCRWWTFLPAHPASSHPRAPFLSSFADLAQIAWLCGSSGYSS